MGASVSSRLRLALVCACAWCALGLEVPRCAPHAGQRHVQVSPSSEGCLPATDGLSRPASYLNQGEGGLCWKLVETLTPPELPPSAIQLASVAHDCTYAGKFDGTVVVGAPATLELEHEDFFYESQKMRRNCELFTELVNTRGGIRLNESARYAVRCVYMDDNASSLQVTNATSRLVTDWGADFVLGPYGSGLTLHAAKQAVGSRRIMLSSSGSSPDIYERARLMADELDALGQGSGASPLVFGLLPESKTYLRSALSAVVHAAAACDVNPSCDRSRCLAGGCRESLRVGLVIEDDVFPRAVCDDAEVEWHRSNGTGGTKATYIPIFRDVDSETYYNLMKGALSQLRDDEVNVVLICSTVSGGIAAVEVMKDISYAPLAAALTVSLSEAMYVNKLREGWWEGEYFIEAQGWSEQLPGQRGQFSNWTSAEYAAAFAEAINGDVTQKPNNFIGAATFAALCALGDAIERAGTLDVDVVASALASSQLVEFYAPVRFNANGQIQLAQFPVVQYAPGAASCSHCADAVHPVVVDYPETEFAPSIHRMFFPMPTWEDRACVVRTGNCSGNGACTALGSCICRPFFYGSACELNCTSESGSELVWDGTTCSEPVKKKKLMVVEITISSVVAALLFMAVAVVYLLWRRRIILAARVEQAEREFARWPAYRGRASRSLLARASLGSGFDKGIARIEGVIMQCSGRARQRAPNEDLVGSRIVTAPGLPPGMYNTFISHVWSSGQDQARSLKGLLQRYVHNIACFLDVDNLDDLQHLTTYVENTSCIIVFLSGSFDIDGTPVSDYMRSKNCLLELSHAIRKQKPLIIVLEADVKHGGVPMSTHLSECPSELQGALEKAPIVPWHRLRDFQTCSMRMLIQELLKAWKIPGADQRIFIPSDILRQPVPTLPCNRPFHVFHSAHNTGVSELVDALAAASGGQLLSTSDTENCQESRTYYFFLYLNATTFVDGDDGVQLGMQLKKALELDLAILPVLEQRSAHQPITFDEVMRRTPKALVAANVYRRIAVHMYDDPHREVSLRHLLIQLSQPPVSESLSLTTLSESLWGRSPRSQTARPAAARPRLLRAVFFRHSVVKQLTKEVAAAHSARGTWSEDDVHVLDEQCMSCAPKSSPDVTAPVETIVSHDADLEAV